MRRKHRKLTNEAELDITAFMNLMIVLVPVLLLSMVFSHTSVINLNFPTGNTPPPSDLEDITQLQLIIRGDRLLIADSKIGVLDQFQKLEGAHDYQRVREFLKQIKARLPGKKDISILSEKTTDYQTLVSVMDTVRSYPAVVAASVVNAELFPDVSIGDAPELTVQAGEGANE